MGNAPLKVALTGNIGSGKSTVAKIFKELGAFVFDADRIIHSFYRREHPLYRRIVETFGDSILDEEGNISRKKLADLVFSDPGKLRKLEELTHGELYRFLKEKFRELPPGSIALVEASLVIEKGTYKNYDRVVLVYAPYEVCKRRAVARGMSEEDFERRWRNQMDIEEKKRYAHYVIDNSGNLEHTRRQVEEVYRSLKELLSSSDPLK